MSCIRQTCISGGSCFPQVLLSLGAPFWYNALKSLSALKPVVANKEAQEQQVKG
jgi:hypothetical protein